MIPAIEFALLMQSTLILGAGVLLTAALKRTGPAYQILVLKTALAASVIVVLAGPVLYTHVSPALKATPWNPSEPLVKFPIKGKIDLRTSIQPTVAQLRSSQLDPRSPLAAPFSHAIGTWVWPVGSVALVLLIAVVELRLSSTRRHAGKVADLEITARLERICAKAAVPTPSLLVSKTISSPFLAGVLRPAIFLPPSLEGETVLEVTFAHEVAHLQQGDCAWRLFGAMSVALLWVQPLSWIAFRLLRATAEDLADQIVVQEFCEPVQYANALLDIAESSSCTPSALSAGVVSSRSHVAKRIAVIVDAAKRFRTRISAQGRIASGLAALSAPVVALSFVAAAPVPFPYRASVVTVKHEVTVNGMRIRLLFRAANKHWSPWADAADTQFLDHPVVELGPGWVPSLTLMAVCDFPGEPNSKGLVDEASLAVAPATASGQQMALTSLGAHYRLQELESYAGYFSGPPPSDVYVATSTQPWRSIGTFIPKTKESIGVRFILDPSRSDYSDEDGMARIGIALDSSVEGQFYRVIAFDISGHPLYQWRETESALDTSVINSSDKYFFRLKPGARAKLLWNGTSTIHAADELPIHIWNISRIELQTRPATWIEFKNFDYQIQK